MIFDNAGCSKICPIWFCIFLPRLRCCVANCVLNVLFLKCTVRWSFLYHVVRKRWNMKPILVQFAICVWKIANMFRKYNIHKLPVVQFVQQVWHNTLETIRHISKCSVFPMPRIMSFHFSLDGLDALDPFPNRLSTLRDLDAFQIDESTFWAASLRVSCCCWTIESGNHWILKSMLTQQISPYSLPDFHHTLW